MKTIFPPNIPAMPMISILEKYAKANGLLFKRTDFNTIKNVYLIYNLDAKILN
jgi:hypothetical protein